MSKYDVVLLEKEGVRGLTKADSMQLFDFMNSEEGYPLEIEAHAVESVAMGFISKEASERLDYDHSGLREFISDILDDMDKESPDNTYSYNGMRIFLSRDFTIEY